MSSELSSSANLAIVGASARAAAFSAIRAGLTPYCWDLYGDADLRSAANIEQVTDLSDENLLRHSAISQLPILYAGGMENHPQWLRRAGDSAVLWGNSESVIRNVRNPLTLAEALQSTRLPVLDVRSSEHPPEADGTWLLKPKAGVGGRGIAVWTPEAADHPTLREPHYFQRRVEGECCSAVFVGRENPGDVEFVGISRQLVGWDAMHASPFTWCGSIGPVMKSIPCEHKIRRIGNVLMWKFRLRGLFGVDFMIDQEETPWVTEVNPRYPASTEIFELACGFTLLRAHATAFGMRWESDAERFETAGQGMVGKGVLFAERSFTMPEIEPNRVAQPFKSLGRIADVSPPGTMIHAGQPVCSLLVEADSSETAIERLQAAASEFEAELLAASRTSPDSNEASVS